MTPIKHRKFLLGEDMLEFLEEVGLDVSFSDSDRDCKYMIS
jgi:hypothetical protein